MQMLLALEVTRMDLIFTYYIIPLISIILSFGVNYVFGVLAVSRLCKRYLPGKAEKLCFLPFLRYYYVGKLAFSGKFNNRGLSWVGVAFPIVRGIAVVMELTIQIMATAFICASNLDIVNFFNADETGMSWQADVEGMLLPAFTKIFDGILIAALVVSLIFGGMLFVSFYRRFKTRQSVFFGILSLLFIDGIFLFVCRNNRTIEEELETMRHAFVGGMPYGNPYANPNQNPYGGPNPYGGSPYGGANPYGQPNQNPNPYATPKHPYGENGTGFGAPTHPHESSADSPFSDLEGGNSSPDSGSPFSEFDNPNN